jgi:hypothetical protein
MLNLVPEVVLSCPEEGCTGTLKRRWSSKFDRYFYGCSQWHITKCNGAIGCHSDGSPLGTPASQKTRKARIDAHTAFDILWQDNYFESRSKAYKWLASVMFLKEIHMAELEYEDCLRVKTLCVNRLNQMNPVDK